MKFHYIDISSFPYPFLHGWILWLACILAVVNNTAGLTGVHLSQLHIDFIPFVYEPTIGIAI